MARQRWLTGCVTGSVVMALLVGLLIIEVFSASNGSCNGPPWPDYQTSHTLAIAGIAAGVLGVGLSVGAVVARRRATFGVLLLLLLTVCFLAAVALFGVIVAVTAENPC